MGHNLDGKSHDDLVDRLQGARLLTAGHVVASFRAVDRRFFVPDAERAYENKPLKLGVAEATISTPQIHATVADLLAPALRPGASVLDIGSGSGYLTTVFADAVASPDGEGLATGIDHLSALTELAAANAGRARPDLAAHVRFVTGNGMAGFEEGGPYDAIHVGAAIPDVLTKLRIAKQLRPGGRMVAPLGAGGAEQRLVVVDRSQDGEGLREEEVLSVVFQPLEAHPPSLSRKEMPRARLERLQGELAAWRDAFASANGRRPTREDLFTDASARAKFDEFSRLHKSWGGGEEGAA